jgi:hypothetical protein
MPAVFCASDALPSIRHVTRSGYAHRVMSPVGVPLLGLFLRRLGKCFVHRENGTRYGTASHAAKAAADMAAAMHESLVPVGCFRTATREVLLPQ